jgi:hypothetical protein
MLDRDLTTAMYLQCKALEKHGHLSLIFPVMSWPASKQVVTTRA